MTDPKDNGWSEYEKHVLHTLKRLEDAGGARDIILNKLVIDVKVIQTKMTMRAGLVGAIAGFLPAAAVLIYFMVKMKANGT